MHAATSLGLSFDYYAGRDETKQSQIVSGNEDDFNGALLYPDGQPRFRLIYVHGGGATAHGKSLGQSGREVFRTFFYNGGSYCGSCAGSFLPAANTGSRLTNRVGYLHIYPYNTLGTGMKKERVGHLIPKDSPLLNFRDFGEDRLVDDIYHNNGNWMRTTEGEHLKDTEILALYDKPDKKVHNGAAIWAHKKGEESGRVIMIGSHPEGAKSGEKLALTEACFLYALAGVAPPKIKAELTAGETRRMVKRSSDREPAFTRIGDRQYHHFTINIEPNDNANVLITLDGEGDRQLNLYLLKGAPAFRSNAKYSNTQAGCKKRLRVELSPGVWNLSIECATTVQSEEIVERVNKYDSKFLQYTGDLSILNGAPYSIGWKLTE